MNQHTARAIVLSRTEYGEADRIISVITPNSGKLRLMARGVRRAKSKLAGAIELFSISDIVYVQGRGQLATLISARLDIHYGNIVRDITRVQLGYDIIKTCNKVTEDDTEPAYFDLLQQSFLGLNGQTEPGLVAVWFSAQLLKLSGMAPNLLTDTDGIELAATNSYNFDMDHMSFSPSASGNYSTDHIKVLRILTSDNTLQAVASVQGVLPLLPALSQLVQTMRQNHLRI